MADESSERYGFPFFIFWDKDLNAASSRTDGDLPLDQLVIKYYNLYTETIWIDLFRTAFLLTCSLRAISMVLCVMWMTQIWASLDDYLCL